MVTARGCTGVAELGWAGGRVAEEAREGAETGADSPTTAAVAVAETTVCGARFAKSARNTALRLYITASELAVPRRVGNTWGRDMCGATAGEGPRA